MNDFTGDKVHFEPMSEPSEGPYVWDGVDQKYKGPGLDPASVDRSVNEDDLNIAYAQGRQSMQAGLEALKSELKTNAGRLKTMTDIGSILATEIGLCPNKEAHPSEGVLTKHFPAKKEKP